MKSLVRVCLIAMLLPCLLPAIAADVEKPENHTNLKKALKAGSFGVGVLYRFESVSDDAMMEDAYGSKLRTNLLYRSGRFHNFSAELEFEDVTDLGARTRHNNGGAGSLSNGIGTRPKIVDPEITGIQRANVSYHGIQDTKVTLGRQEFGLANQRFVGPVGWRLHHQSFEAFRIDQASIPNTKLTYVFIDRANAITGATARMGSHILQAEIDAGDWGKITPYWLDLDYDDAANFGKSTATFGASWAGAFKTGDWKIPYRLEIAQQEDSGDNPATVDAGYRHVSIGGATGHWTVVLGQEVLEGDAMNGVFSTPLATLHAFNGWADKFLGTPPAGLEDLYLSVGYKHKALMAKLVFHDFTAESTGPDYGNEIDGVLSYKSAWGQVFAIKLALFSADSAGGMTDTDKLWFFTKFSF